ncbi:MAG TPA: hypothetical protein VLL25_16775, partial [Acidimicrobiales bacterium]|nr:hypothetical protein [Acidimicrobiales bacterium]
MAGPSVARLDLARVVRVVPDVPAINKEFDYLVPDHLGHEVRIGAMVRIELHGRRVGGWVVADRVTPPTNVSLRPLRKVTGWGPPTDLVDLSSWAAWRWAGRRSAFLRTASPETAIRALPSAGFGTPPAAGDEMAIIEEAFATDDGRVVLRLPPAAELLSVVLAAARRGPALVVAPSVATVATMAAGLRRAHVRVATVPREWAQAAAGAQVVMGARAAAWAPCPGMAAVVVLDGHDEGLQQEQTPTWNGWVVAAERAARAG